MRRYGWVFAAVFFAFWALGARAERPQKLVRVKVENVQSAAVQAFLRTGPDVAGYDPRTKTLVVFARPRDLRRLDELGLGYQVEIESLARVEQQMRASGYFDHFHNYERCKQELEWAETNYPDLAKVYDIGDGWEKTQGIADRDILAIKISDNVAEQEDEPEVLILSNHHAREIITPEIAVYMVHYLLENYGKDPYVTYLVDHRQIWIIPTMNPDGLDYVFTQDRWWRKNRRDNGDGSFGVDLNRNYAYKWGYNDVGSSPDPSSNIYRGTGPFSEPETQAIRDLCIAHHFKIILSYHSYSQLYLYPWGYVAKNTPDNYVFVALGDSMAHYNGYVPGNVASGAIYLTNGDSDDWFYGEQEVKNKIFGLTVEVGTSFFPDTTEIMPQILENLQPNLFAIWAVGEEPVVDVPRVPDTENAVGPYTVKARIRPAITLTDTCILDPASFFLHYSFDGASWDSVQMAATGAPDVYAGQIPGRGAFGPVYFYVTAWSVDGRRGAWPRPAPAAVDSFLVTEDVVAPTIVHNPLPDQSAYKGTYEVDVELLDDAGIDSAWLEYWTDAAVFSVELEPRDSVYVGEIVLNPPVPGETVHYRIFARDASANRNVAVAPERGSYSFKILDYQVFDLETDSVLTPTSGTDWQWGVPTSGPAHAHSGVKVWATNLSGKYRDNADDRLNTPPIDLRGAERPIFEFWHWYDFEYSGGRLWDGGNLKISVDGGPFELLTTVVGGYDHIVDSYNRVLGGEQAFGGPPGTGDFWHPTYVDLAPYVGHTVVIQFHFGSDAHATEDGWYIDDIAWKVFRKGAPQVAVVQRPRNTDDTAGPYAVVAQAWDDTAVTSVKLYYALDGDFQEIEMTSTGDSLYTGDIPGQPLGSKVRFYVEATDNSGNVSRDPLGAPNAVYSFEVTDAEPSARVSPVAL
ncbi:MAG: zinc carboxypeptidase, partial [Calditrichaeota bacterium]|nr:zinc carboxypeptidase [Calditrichota bacterium]